jgi:hypothetical protein
MDHGGLWICPAGSDAGTGRIGCDGSTSANRQRRGHIASEGHGWFRRCPLIAIRACGDDGEQDEVANPSDIRCTKKPLRLESPTSHGRAITTAGNNNWKNCEIDWDSCGCLGVTAPSRELGTRSPQIRRIDERRRHQPRRPPHARIRPGSPAPAVGPGTAVPLLATA